MFPSRQHRSGGWVVFLLLVVCMGGFFIWPPYKVVIRSGISSLTHSFKKAEILPLAGTQEVFLKSKTRLAEQARSMEFRVQEYPIRPATIREWCEEWNCDPIQKMQLLRLLIGQLPESAAKETALAQRNDLVQSIFDLGSEGKKIQPDNGFYWLTDALALFYSDQDKTAILSLQEMQKRSRVDAGLKEINRAEYDLWVKESKSWILFPSTPRVQKLDLERPLYTLSRGLALQQRALLQKYNMERAVELTLLHLGLAMRVTEAGWAPADLAIARSMVNRALEPFWTNKAVTPTPQSLGENFLAFLEDQGDKLSAAKVRAWLEDLSKKENLLKERLPRWRKLQLISHWNASGVVGSLVILSLSLFLVWLTLRMSVRETDSSWRVSHFTGLVFILVPILWSTLRWPYEGIHQLTVLGAAWVIWGMMMRMTCPGFGMPEALISVRRNLVTMLMSLGLFAGAVAWVLQYRQEQIFLLTRTGLFSLSN